MDKVKRKGRLLPSIQQELGWQFGVGISTRSAIILTAILYFYKPRELITTNLAGETTFLDGKVEVAECYFCGRRKGKRACRSD